jgi:hypothetical protein
MSTTSEYQKQKLSPELLRILHAMNDTKISIHIQRDRRGIRIVDLENASDKFDRELTEALRMEILSLYRGEGILDRNSRYWPELLSGEFAPVVDIPVVDELCCECRKPATVIGVVKHVENFYCAPCWDAVNKIAGVKPSDPWEDHEPTPYRIKRVGRPWKAEGRQT